MPGTRDTRARPAIRRSHPAAACQRAFPGVSVRQPTVSGMTMVQGTFDDLGTPCRR